MRNPRHLAGEPARADPDSAAQATTSDQDPTTPDDDPTDYQFDPARFQRFAQDFGPFDLDLCADPAGHNALCQQYYSRDDPAQHHDLSGKTVWCNGPYDATYADILRHYLECKSKQPTTTSGVFVVPGWPNAPWEPYLVNMKLVREYPRGTPLFSAPAGRGQRASVRRKVPPTRWPVLVYWDPPTSEGDAPGTPATPATCPPAERAAVSLQTTSTAAPSGDMSTAPAPIADEQVSERPPESPENPEQPEAPAMQHDEDVNPACEGMVLRGRFCGRTCKILLDCGATGRHGNFVSRQLLERFSIPTDTQDPKIPAVEVRVADGRSNVSTAFVTRKLHIGKYKQTVRFTVADLPDHEIILGVPWWKEHQPHLDFKKMVTTFLHKGHTYSVAGKTQEDAQTSFTRLQQVTAKQFARGLKDYEETYLLILRSAADLEQYIGKQLQDSDLPEDIPARVKELILKHPNVFPKKPPAGLPRHKYRHHIDLVPGAQPQHRPLFRMSEMELTELRDQLRDMLEKEHIQPSCSPWAAPVLFARKKDGGLRLCVDYRALNKMTVRNRYPLPRIEDLLDRLSKAKYLTKLDLAAGFWQIPVDPADIPKTAFTTRYGQFEFKVMPMGLCNAPSTFQSAMNDILRDFLDDFVLVYMDDILIYSNSEEEHLRHLQQVFKKLEQNQLYCRPHKCTFMKEELKYLGHIVGNGHIKVDPTKVTAVNDWPAPTNLKELQSFLGHCNYYRRFIQGYAKHARPLTELLKKEHTYRWTPECQSSFDTLKTKLTNAPVLRIFDNSRPVQLVTDASSFAIGAVLLQEHDNKWQPIAFESRKLRPPEINYSAYDRELLALVHCCKLWRCYLLGRRFQCITDHATLKHFHTQPCLTSPRRVRWSEYLQDFEVDIVYRPGRTDPADPLSRRPDLAAAVMALQATSKLQLDPTTKQQLLAGYRTDPYFRATENLRYFDTDEHHLFYLRGRLCIPDIPELKRKLMREHHEAPYASHPGVKRTLDTLARHYFWPRMGRDVQSYVLSCPTCQQNKYANTKPKGLLQPLPVSQRRWSDISMDLITHLPPIKSTGNDAIFVVVDRLSKMVRFIPCNHKITAVQLAKLFVQEIFKLHGLPQVIVSDRDPKFTSDFWRALFQQLGTKLAMSSGYHPQTDGQTERTNRTLEEMLRHYCGSPDKQTLWEDLLPLAEFAYNNTKQTSTGQTPFFLNYGQDPLTPGNLAIDNATPTLQVPAADEWLQRLNQALADAQASLERAADNQAHYTDRRRQPFHLQPGDLVYVEKTALPIKKRGTKISHLRHGPYPIIKTVGNAAYQVKLPAKWRVHNVFHASQLTPIRRPTRPRIPETIVKYDPGKKKRFCVSFADGSDYEHTWVTQEELRRLNPVLLQRFILDLARNPQGF